MQKYISALVLFLLGMPVAVFAVSLQGFDIPLPNGITISSAGDSSADTMTINSDNVTFILSSGQSIHLSATSRNILNNDQNATKGCSSTQSTLDYELPEGTTAATLIVTPSSSTCSTSGGGGGSGSVALSGSPGGGGGGGGTLIPSIPATVVPAPVVASPQVQQTPAASVSPVFNVNLRLGSRNNDVTRLQTLLGQDSALYPEKIISGYYGRLTEAAVKRFQKKYGLPQVGVVGPLTRAKLNAVFGIGVVLVTPPVQPDNSAQISTIQALIQSLQLQITTLQQQQSTPAAPSTPSGGSSSGGCNTAYNSGLICLP